MTCTRISHVHESLGPPRRVVLVVDFDSADVACELADAFDLLDRVRPQASSRLLPCLPNTTMSIVTPVVCSLTLSQSALRSRPCGEYRQRPERDLPDAACGQPWLRAPRAHRGRAAPWPPQPGSRPWSRRRRRSRTERPETVPAPRSVGPARRSPAAETGLGRAGIARQQTLGPAAELDRDCAREQRAMVDAERDATARAGGYPGDRRRTGRARSAQRARARAPNQRTASARCDTSPARRARARRPRTRTRPPPT